ncbi:GntR family transcriptional regulator [Limobrevibacterium gyesilva]|uniref:GntR family transcriptional regulator n=1 Tax=Limobrevibacterium gyesilva TaxID=2991712 RepID=A0AA42CGU0_9PROT|nr:GntR family transcriptional regulator [Limobrevibacterium gyesilva]MCW3474317.1 GntR family transcriptional regulator [Limobrevibacterium gyesilva]
MDDVQDDRDLPPAATGGPVMEATYSRLRADILSGALPPGGKLKLDVLRDRYDASINTLRETLSRLVADGLVQSEGQRGFTVVPASLADLRDITEMRRMLECEAARRSLQRADLEWEARVVAAYHKLSRIEAVVDENHERWGGKLEEYNREFHAALISACGSRWLLHLFGVMYDQSLRYRMLALQTKDFPRAQSRREHRELLDAALARDADRVTEVLGVHITKGLELYLPLETDAVAPAPKPARLKPAGPKPARPRRKNAETP